MLDHSHPLPDDGERDELLNAAAVALSKVEAIDYVAYRGLKNL